MKFVALLITSLLYVKCSILSDEQLYSLEKEEIFVPAEIISNYLYKYLSREKVFLSIVSDDFHNNFINILLSHQKLSSFSYNILKGIEQTPQGNTNAFNIVIVDEHVSLSNILNELTIQQFHLSQRFLIIATQAANAVEIFGIAMELGLLNVHVLTRGQNAQMWTLQLHKPYMKSCYSFEIQKIDSFTPENYTFELNIEFDELFSPQKVIFKNCPLFISTFSVPPFVIIRKNNGSIQYDGIDVVIVNKISETLNLIPIYMQSPDKQNRGVVLWNGVATGAIKMVLNRHVNMTVGAYSTSRYRVRFMAYGKSYMQNALVFVYPYCKEYSSSMQTLIAPFQSAIWYSVAMLLMTSILVILLTKRLSKRQRHFIIGGRMNRTPILNMFYALRGMAIPNPKVTHQRYFGVFARTLLLIWILFWIVVRSSYEGSLFSFLQSRRITSPYDSVKKVQTSNVSIHLMKTAVYLVSKDFDRSRFVTYNGSIYDILEGLSKGEYGGISITYDMIVNYFNKKKNHRALGVTDMIRPVPLMLFFQKHSILTSIFDRKIEMCLQSGLITYWTGKYTHIQKRKTPGKAKPLDIPSILTILKIWAVMLIIACIVFVLEVLSDRLGFIGKLLDFITY